MRNLKRVLALALALIMTLGLMITASAASYPDADQIDAKYTEAVEVLSGLGVFKGQGNSGTTSFAPKAILTRGEVATLVYRILTGDVKDAQIRNYDYTSFEDVKEGQWWTGYITYAANGGYVKGYNGYFNPQDEVTGVQVLAIMLRAIGRGQNGEYEGAAWKDNVLTDARDLGLLKSVATDDLDKGAARELVAQLLFNAITIPNIVTYSALLGYQQTPEKQTLGAKTFKLAEINGVVTANEYADLDSTKALAAGKTTIDGKTYNVSTALTDIGESRRGWAADKDVLFLTDTGKNVVYQTGDATSFLDKKGAFDSSAFSKITGLKYGKDTEEYKQFDDALVDTFEADIRIVYSLDGTYANSVPIKAGTTFKKDSQTYTDLYNIFNEDDYETGWVLVGTTASSTDPDKNLENDVSNDMSFKKFVATYLVPDEENTVTVEETVNGDWLKVVDNDNDGVADYVFLTEFTMEEVAGVSKKGVLSFTGSATEFGGTAKGDIPYVTSEEDLAKGDIILYTVIDGTAYVELAPNFTGEVDKYTYKTNVLTVDGEDYTQSGIVEHTGYLNELEDAEKETDYTYYQDFFGHIRVFSEPANSVGNLVLLTDAYYQTGKTTNEAAVKAYLNDELGTYDVNTKKTGDFIDTNNDNNGWDKLIEYADCTYGTPATNVARYSESDGVLSLSTAKTYTFDKKGNENGIATDYVDLYEQTFKAGETDFDGYYAFQPSDATKYGLTADMVNNGEVTVQANKNTVFYYVSRDAKGNAVVDNVVVGYKNTVAVTAEDEILAMYAVASNVRSDSSKINYWVADVIVIETEEPVAAISKDVTLVYNVENKTYKDYAGVEALDNTAKDVDLTVISLNGNNYNKFEQSDITNPWFYTNSVDKNGDSYLRQITRNYGDYGIYAATVDRENKLFEYFKTVDGKTIEFNADTLPVYDIVEKAKANELDDDDGDLTLKTGESYIVYAVKNKAVYAIHVDGAAAKALTGTQILYNAIVADAGKLSDYDAAVKAAKEALIANTLTAMKPALTDLNALTGLTTEQQAYVNDLKAALTDAIKVIEDADAAAKALRDAQDNAISNLKAAIVAAVKTADTSSIISDYDAVLTDDTTDTKAAFAPLTGYETVKKAIDVWSSEINNEQTPAAVQAKLDAILASNPATLAGVYVNAVAAEQQTAGYKEIANNKAAAYLEAIKTQLASAITWSTGDTVKGLVETEIAKVTPNGNAAEYTVAVTAPTDVSFVGNTGTKTVTVNVSVTNSYAGVVSDAQSADIVVTFSW